MLFKQIHLSTSYASCFKYDSDYAFTMDTYMLDEDKQTCSLFIELDSLFRYAEINDIDEILKNIKDIKQISIHTETFNNQTKRFIYYKHLNPIIANVHFYLRKNGNDSNKLKEAMGTLYFTIILKYKNENPEIADPLGMFFM